MAKTEPLFDPDGARLQNHVDRLNAMSTGRVWYITGEPPNRKIESRKRFKGAA